MIRMMAPEVIEILGLLPDSLVSQDGKGTMGLGKLKESKEKQVNCYSLEPATIWNRNWRPVMEEGF